MRVKSANPIRALLQQLAAEGPEKLDELLLDVDSALSNLPALNLEDALVAMLRHGRSVQVQHVPETGKLRIYDNNHRFLGLAEALQDGRIVPRRLISGLNS